MIGVSDIRVALDAHPVQLAEVLDRFRALGGSYARWGRRDRELLARALTSVEDSEEMRLAGRWTAARAALREVRRRLEDELHAEEQRARGAA